MNEANHGDIAKAKLNLETSQIHWTALQRFFAAGSVIFVGPALDLVDVAYQFSIDNKQQVEQWLKDQQLNLASDEQAKKWLATDALLWTTLVKPWVLVQE